MVQNNGKIVKKMYIVGIENGSYTLIEEVKIFHEDGNNESGYKRYIVNGQMLINAMNNGQSIENAAVWSGKLTGTTGSLDRFKREKDVNVPCYVILNEIRERNTGKLLGYKLANSKGVVNRPLHEVMGLCELASRHNVYAIQNGVYVKATEDKKAHIRTFVGNGYAIEYITINKNKNSRAVKVSPESKKNVKKLDVMFSPEQIKEMKLAHKNGVDIAILANPGLSPEQMRVIGSCESNGLHARKFANPEYSLDTMKYLAAELQTKANIDNLLNPNYSIEQLFALTLGQGLGLDINQFSDPKYSSEQMMRKLGELREKQWGEVRVGKGSLDIY